MKNTKKELLAIADQCVKCGQCLSVCPTYNLYQNEAESPRGRITLIQGLLSGQIDQSDETTLLHLDHCLYCGNCESACPSGVNYRDLLDTSKQLFSAANLPEWQLDLLTSRKLLKTAVSFSRFIPGSLANFLPDAFKNSLAFKLPGHSKKSGNKLSKTVSLGKLGLFTGCVGNLVDNRAIQMTTDLLEHCGYEVVVPDKQSCCGAMYQHEGYSDKAHQLAQSNQQVFSDANVERVLYFASGCGSQLLDHQDFSLPACDATTFISSLPQVRNLHTSIQDRISIHKPCSMKDTGDSWRIMIDLVKDIAGDKLVELPGNDTCCGSAGLHLLKHPKAASQLLEPKLEALQAINPDILLTANTGCAFHFYNGINNRGLDIRVMHPAEWITELVLNSPHPALSPKGRGGNS